jgi:YHS domain-containing protein
VPADVNGAATNTLTVANLQNGQTYYFAVQSHNATRFFPGRL